MSFWLSQLLRTEKSADSRARKKRLETERKLRGRQMCGRVLGIDPSLRGTGLAVLEAREDGTLVYIESLTVKNRPTLSMPECLARILEETDGIIRRNKPDCVAIEQSVYVQNFRTALILGSSRGAAIAAAASLAAEAARIAAGRVAAVHAAAAGRAALRGTGALHTGCAGVPIAIAAAAAPIGPGSR